MPYLFDQTASDLNLAFIANVVGDASTTISLSSYYAGGEFMYAQGAFPASGAISLQNFVGTVSRWRLLQNFTASGSFTVPANVNRIFVVIVGGGGGGGANAFQTNGDGTTTQVATGGAGGYGGLAMVYQDVTPSASYTVTVGARGGAGGAGGSSIFNGITATGGSPGTNAKGQTGGGDVPVSPPANGVTGANGTSSGTNLVSGLTGTNVTAAGWVNNYDTIIGRFVGTSNATNRTNITVVRNQTATRGTTTVWAPTGALRPGGGGLAASAAQPGAVMVYY